MKHFPTLQGYCYELSTFIFRYSSIYWQYYTLKKCMQNKLVSNLVISGFECK